MGSGGLKATPGRNPQVNWGSTRPGRSLQVMEEVGAAISILLPKKEAHTETFRNPHRLVQCWGDIFQWGGANQ